jgi:quinol monooxygenase YgiN
MPLNAETLLITGVIALGAYAVPPASAQTPAAPVVRWADLSVDPARLSDFKAAANEHGSAVLDAEPGVLALHAVAEKDNPSSIHVFEMYVDAAAYQAHLRSPHFQRFRTRTEKWIIERQLHEGVPVRLAAKSQLTGQPLVRVADLEIDPAQLEAYKAAVSEEIDDSIKKEPGVLTIYSVALKDRPNRLRFFEIYADDNAYRQHIASPHFRKYAETTKTMIMSRKLVETEPLFLRLRER